MSEKQPFISYGDTYDLPDYGVYQLTIVEAANLITACIYDDKSLPNDIQNKIDKILSSQGEEWVDHDDPRVSKLLNLFRIKIESSIAESVANKDLKSARLRKNVDNSISVSETYIDYYHLLRWLEMRGIILGDLVDEYIDAELDLSSILLNRVNYVRKIMQNENMFSNSKRYINDDIETLKIDNERLVSSLERSWITIKPI